MLINQRNKGFWVAGALLLAAVLLKAPSAWGAGPEETFHRYCVQCHGAGGKGDGVNAPKMDRVPSDLTNAEKLGQRSDDQIAQIIAKGGARTELSPLMPPWGYTLSQREIDSLVKHIRKLCKCRGR